MLNAPAIIRYLIAGYRTPKDRQRLIGVVTEGWCDENNPNSPTIEQVDRLLKGEIPFTVDETNAVCFTVP